MMVALIQELSDSISRARTRATQAPLRFLHVLGEMVTLLAKSIAWTFRPPFRVSQLFQQMEYIGVGSMSIIVLVSLFTGGVFGLQSVEAFRMFQADGFVGTAVSLTLSREISPVITALMVAGRSGSAMATGLGSMRISEQIDALATMAVNPIQYLVVPRLLASVLVMPMLTMVFNVCGIMGAYVFVVGVKGVDPGIFVHNIRWHTDIGDLMMGLIKSLIFGLVVALIGCHQGYNASGGARGVGMATMRSVVLASVAVLVFDFIITDVLISLGI